MARQQSSDNDLPNDLITPKEAARAAKCHVSAIYRWVLSGRLRGWKRGTSRYFVSRKDVEALARPVEVKPPPAEVELPRTEAQEQAAAADAEARLRAQGWKV